MEVTPNNLKIAENVPLILALHRELDAFRESADFGGVKIGTTKRGIGPAYEDKVGRRAIRLMDLAEPESLDGKIARLLAHHEPLRRGMGLPAPTAAAIKDELMTAAPKVLPYMAPTYELLDELRRAGKRILFEGAQGALLDVDHGTYPYVTSSNTVAAAAATGSGLGPRAIGYVLGIAKAYTTRVGGGPFPTELDDEVGRLIGQRGAEFGTNTGRPRRCGWFDAVLTRQTVKTSGIDGVALTKLDILDGFETLKVCYALSSRRRKRSTTCRRRKAAQARVEPIYETIEGWSARHQRRALMGRLAGAGGQIRAANRRTDRRAGRVALDESEAGRYDSRAQSIPRLTLLDALRASRRPDPRMADYYTLLAKAVSNLPKAGPEPARKAIYDRARKALVRQLRSLGPALSEADIAREEAALEAAIGKLEGQFSPAAPTPPSSSPARPTPSAAGPGRAAAVKLCAAAAPGAVRRRAAARRAHSDARHAARASRSAAPSAPRRRPLSERLSASGAPPRPSYAPSPAAARSLPAAPIGSEAGAGGALFAAARRSPLRTALRGRRVAARAPRRRRIRRRRLRAAGRGERRSSGPRRSAPPTRDCGRARRRRLDRAAARGGGVDSRRAGRRRRAGGRRLRLPVAAESARPGDQGAGRGPDGGSGRRPRQDRRAGRRRGGDAGGRA